jgi:cytochrome b subunit of formate dehydrogenase
MQILKFSAGTVERIGSVMKVTYLKDKTVNVDDMKELTALREQLFGEEKYCTLIDLTKDLLSLSPEAKEYAAKNETIRRLRIAEVLLVKNFAQKLGVHTYVKIFRSNDNVKVMVNEMDAITWLNEQYQNYSKKEAV